MTAAVRIPVSEVPFRVTPARPSLHVVPDTVDAALQDHPEDWTSVKGVTIGGDHVDRVAVGPNGVFVVVVDPAPGRLTPDGVLRDGDRVKEPVKRALRAAHELRRRIGVPGVFAYPVLLCAPGIEPGYLGRLRVVGADRFADALWCHPGRSLRRSERAAVLDVLDGMTAPGVL